MNIHRLNGREEQAQQLLIRHSSDLLLGTLPQIQDRGGGHETAGGMGETGGN